MSNATKYDHPQRYTGKDGKDLIDRLEEGMISKEQTRGFLKGNILKYVTRYESKDGTKDLLKAKEYLKRLIAFEEAEKKRENEKDGTKDLLKAKKYLKRLIVFEETEKKRENEKFVTIEIELLPKGISKEQAKGFLKSNILKYVTRYESKDGTKDLLKAKEYLKRLIAFEEAEKGTMRKY